MGNWITVNVNGKLNKLEASEMIEMLTCDKKTYTSRAEEELGVFYLQISHGLAGLGQWINHDGNINAVGNVYERDCTVEDLVDELAALSNKFKSLEMVLHVGGDYESTECVATVKVNNGNVELLTPQVRLLHEISEEQVMQNLMKQLGRT